MTTGLQTKIKTRYLPNKSYECYSAGHDVSSVHCQTVVLSRLFMFNCFITFWLFYVLLILPGPDNAVGIASHYRLNGPGIESWWTSVQTAPETHPTSCTLGTASLYWG